MRSVAQELWHLVKQRTGFEARDNLVGALNAHVQQRLGLTGLASASDWLAALSDAPLCGSEWQELLNIVRNGETSFMRDHEQLSAAVALLADMLATASNRTLQIWSAGCSTGEEAFSLAMLCEELEIPAQITATDISSAAIESARQACYSAWSIRNLSRAMRTRFFHASAEGYTVADALREKVHFEQHNLMDTVYPRPEDGSHGWDLILCRNVCIYFARTVTHQIVGKLAATLAPEGLLVLGSCESLHGQCLPLDTVSVHGRIAYARRLIAAPESEHEQPLSRAPVRPGSVAVQELPASPAGSPAAPKTEGPLDAVVDFCRSERLLDAADLLQHCDLPELTRQLAIGHVSLRQHQLDAALKAYEQARDLEPLLAEVHCFAGLAHKRAGELEAAGAALERALFLAPPFWQASFLMAGVYQRLGRRRDWMREIRRTLHILEESPDLFSFTSHPHFVSWFFPSKHDVRQFCADLAAKTKKES